jgi:hypothetical protein
MGFRSISFAVDVFKWAHDMKIESLMLVLKDYFEDKAEPSQIFEIFELYYKIGYQEGLAWCKKVILLLF